MNGAAEIGRISDCFDAEGYFVSAEPFAGGLINASWLVTQGGRCGARRYLLQRINDAIFPEPEAVMANIAAVTRHLMDRADGGETLRFVAAGETLLHREPDGSCWRLAHFIEGTHSRSAVTNAAEAETAGGAYGRFLSRLADFPAERLIEVLPGFHDTPARLDACQREIAADRTGRAAAARVEIEALLAQRSLAATLTDLIRAGRLPLRVVHNDAKLANVLLDVETDEAVCVVDLDTVMPGSALFDFGDMLRTMACPADEDEIDLSLMQIDSELFRALAGGYLAEAGSVLTDVERSLLVTAGAVITFEQAIRFLADHLAGDVYYKTDRAGQNLQRCRSQLRLLESILARQKDLERIIES